MHKRCCLCVGDGNRGVCAGKDRMRLHKRVDTAHWRHGLMWTIDGTMGTGNRKSRAVLGTTETHKR